MLPTAKVNTLNQSAQTAFERKNYPEAVRIYLQVKGLIDPVAHPAAHAETRNNLSVALLKSGNAPEALVQADGTELIFSELRDPHRQAIALGNIAAALVELQRYDEALEKYQLSADLFKQSGNEDMRSYVLREISVLQMRRGKQVDSLFAMDAALQSKKQLNWREALLKRLMGTVHKMLGNR